MEYLILAGIEVFSLNAMMCRGCYGLVRKQQKKIDTPVSTNR